MQFKDLDTGDVFMDFEGDVCKKTSEKEYIYIHPLDGSVEQCTATASEVIEGPIDLEQAERHLPGTSVDEGWTAEEWHSAMQTVRGWFSDQQQSNAKNDPHYPCPSPDAPVAIGDLPDNTLFVDTEGDLGFIRRDRIHWAYADGHCDEPGTLGVLKGHVCPSIRAARILAPPEALEWLIRREDAGDIEDEGTAAAWKLLASWMEVLGAPVPIPLREVPRNSAFLFADGDLGYRSEDDWFPRISEETGIYSEGDPLDDIGSCVYAARVIAPEEIQEWLWNTGRDNEWTTETRWETSLCVGDWEIHLPDVTITPITPVPRLREGLLKAITALEKYPEQRILKSELLRLLLDTDNGSEGHS